MTPRDDPEDKSTNSVTLVLILALAAFLALPAERAFAICPAAEIEVAPSSVAPGREVTVRGLGFLTCFELEICPGELCEPRRDIPLRDIDLVLAQGADEWTLATVDADDNFRFTQVVTLPEEIAAGRATITAPGTDARASLSIAWQLPDLRIVLAVFLAVSVALGALVLKKRRRDRIAL